MKENEYPNATLGRRNQQTTVPVFIFLTVQINEFFLNQFQIDCTDRSVQQD